MEKKSPKKDDIKKENNTGLKCLVVVITFFALIVSVTFTVLYWQLW